MNTILRLKIGFPLNRSSHGGRGNTPVDHRQVGAGFIPADADTSLVVFFRLRHGSPRGRVSQRQCICG